MPLATVEANEYADQPSGAEHADAKEAAKPAADLAQDASKRGWSTLTKLVDKLAGASQEDPKPRRRRVVKRAIFFAASLLFLELVLMGFAKLGVLAYVILSALSIVTTIVSLLVYEQTNHFSWFGVAAFLSVSLFIGASTYFRTRANPEAEPTAALVSSTKAVAGYFVAQTSDRVYLGEPAGSGLPSRLVGLDRAQVTALSIGPLTRTEASQAIDVANRMAKALCKQVPQPEKGATARRGCPSLTVVTPLY